MDGEKGRRRGVPMRLEGDRLLSQGRDGTLADCRLYRQLNSAVVPGSVKETTMLPTRFPSIAAVLAAAALLCAASAAMGQTPPAAPQPPPQAPAKPYNKVTLSMPARVSDPALDALRKQIADIAQRKERAALAPLIVSQGFFWEREAGSGADDKKSALDNFAAAVGLDAKDGSGWEAVADYAAEPTAAQVGDRKDLVCAPVMPSFSDEEFLDIVKATDTDPAEWGFPLKDGIEAHETAKPDSKVVEKLGMHFVRVMPDFGATESDLLLRIVTPAGKVAYIRADELSPLGIDQLCYLKEGNAWKIAGYVGEGALPQ
jgi:hypothetical protein